MLGEFSVCWAFSLNFMEKIRKGVFCTLTLKIFGQYWYIHECKYNMYLVYTGYFTVECIFTYICTGEDVQDGEDGEVLYINKYSPHGQILPPPPKKKKKDLCFLYDYESFILWKKEYEATKLNGRHIMRCFDTNKIWQKIRNLIPTA